MVDKLEIDCEINAKKIERRMLVLDYFIEEDLTTEEQLSDNSNNEIEIKRLEYEHKAREQERDHDFQLKLKELELREGASYKGERNAVTVAIKELELLKAATPVSTETPHTTAPFDAICHVWLVPPFQEQKVDNFFLISKK